MLDDRCYKNCGRYVRNVACGVSHKSRVEEELLANAARLSATISAVARLVRERHCQVSLQGSDEAISSRWKNNVRYDSAEPLITKSLTRICCSQSKWREIV